MMHHDDFRGKGNKWIYDSFEKKHVNMNCSEYLP